LESSASSHAAGADEGSKPARQRTSSGRASFDRDRIDALCERGILGCVLGILIFGPLATGATLTSQFLVLLGLGVLIVPLWLTRIWARKQYRFLFPPFAWTVIAFAGYAVWRYTQSDIEYSARMELLQILLYALLFFAVLDNLNRQESVQIILFSLVGLGMVNAFYAIYQYYTDSQFILWYDKPAIYRGRGSGTYICPNHLAGFLEMVLPVALAYTITGRYKPLTKVFLGYAAVAILGGIGVTISRGGYVALGISLLVFFVVLLWNRDFRIPALAVVILLLVGGSFFGFRSYKSQLRFADMEDNIRLHYWRPALELWKENFWFGVGAGHYDWRFRPWRYWNLQGQPIYVHNDYLNTVTEYGTAGGAIIAASILTLGWGLARSWKYVRRTNEIATKPSNRSAVVLGCSVGVLAILVHSVTDFNMHIPANAITAVTLIAIVVSYWRFATERYWLNPGVLGRLFLTLVIGGTGGYLAWQVTKVGSQTYLLGKFGVPMTFEESLDLFERAHRADPKNGLVTLAAGELIRKKGWEGSEGYEKLLREAIPWFEKGVENNKWNPYNHMNLGMCYHWLNEPEKATAHFDRMLELDPKNHYVVAHYGWHKLQLNDLEGAQKYFKESIGLSWQNNPIATTYLEIVERRLAENAGAP
jgi:O-antigen ligase